MGNNQRKAGDQKHLRRNFISAIVGVAGDKVIVALFLTMLTCIVLGMGVPTTANYIIMATTCAPILVNGMGINPIAANMFVFYFGISGGLEGYMFNNMNVIQRLMAVIGGLCMMIPGTMTDIIGVVLVGASCAWQMAEKKKATA